MVTDRLKSLLLKLDVINVLLPHVGAAASGRLLLIPSALIGTTHQVQQTPMNEPGGPCLPRLGPCLPLLGPWSPHLACTTTFQQSTRPTMGRLLAPAGIPQGH